MTQVRRRGHPGGKPVLHRVSDTKQSEDGIYREGWSDVGEGWSAVGIRVQAEWGEHVCVGGVGCSRKVLPSPVWVRRVSTQGAGGGADGNVVTERNLLEIMGAKFLMVTERSCKHRRGENDNKPCGARR